MTAATTLARARAALENRQPLTPGEVGLLLRAHPKTVSRWVRDGRLAGFTTPGGQRRIDPDTVARLLDEMTR